MPETSAVTAYLRIAPTAISRSEVPIVIRVSIPARPAAQPPQPVRWTLVTVRSGHGRVLSREASKRALCLHRPLVRALTGAPDPARDPPFQGAVRNEKTSMHDIIRAPARRNHASAGSPARHHWRRVGEQLAADDPAGRRTARER